jgi:hypothetical protein
LQSVGDQGQCDGCVRKQRPHGCVAKADGDFGRCAGRSRHGHQGEGSTTANGPIAQQTEKPKTERPFGAFFGSQEWIAARYATYSS